MEIDRETLQKARELDSGAVSELVKIIYPEIFRYFFYHTPSREDAEDLTGEVMLRMVKGLKRQKGDFRAWIFRISRNLLTDYYRKRGKVKTIPLDEVGEGEWKREGKEDNFRPEEWNRFLARLSPEQREVVILRFFEGYSLKEVAEIMGKGEGAVKLLQFRALKNLREILKKEGERI